MTNRVACIIPNYNMAERAQALINYIFKNCQHNKPEIILVDNGSEGVWNYGINTLGLPVNVQTTNAWLMGMNYADALEVKYKGSFFAYWVIITSAEFVPESRDPLAPMVEMMEKNYHTVGVSPALTEDSTTSWQHMITSPLPRIGSPQIKRVFGGNFRETWMLDNICTLWRADWFNSIGRFDPRLYYAWGIDLETSYKARAQGKSLWICEDVQVKKVTDIGYTMGRMGMTAEERRVLARENMDEVFTQKYGPDWKTLMYDAGQFEFGGKV